MFPPVVTQAHVVCPVELVVVPGGDEDVHRVSDHGEVGGPAAVPHHTADPRVVKPGEERVNWYKLQSLIFVLTLNEGGTGCRSYFQNYFQPTASWILEIKIYLIDLIKLY